ncbi:hypothetical protein ACLQ2Q_07050 [Microbacterium sp. DT81.1]|uniref:hypothetical protein n=1 Tax=Microbacterium sp. DT81.1 TaxID=3393413 RepID=UPI003CF165B2
MDAAARAELAALRRRAYSRDADIAGDSVALKRLAELEELALPARPAAPVPSCSQGDPEAEAPTSGPIADERATSGAVIGAGPPVAGPATGRPSPRGRLIVGLVGAVAVLAAALSTVAALQVAPDPTRADAATAAPTAGPAGTDVTADDPVTIPLLIDSLRGEFIDFSERPDVPMFLANGVTSWVQPLGVYYGWALWVAGVSSGQGPENCLLVTDGTATEAQCIPAETTVDGALEVSLRYDKLADYQRPQGMTPDQQVTFDWGGGAYVTMEITDSR